jgi:hypothetical protein
LNQYQPEKKFLLQPQKQNPKIRNLLLRLSKAQSQSTQNENPATRATTVQHTPTNRELCEIQNPKKEKKKKKAHQTLVKKKQIPRTLKPTPAMILMKQAGGQSVSRSVSHMTSRK